jgi:hypothetical protein
MSDEIEQVTNAISGHEHFKAMANSINKTKEVGTLASTLLRDICTPIAEVPVAGMSLKNSNNNENFDNKTRLQPLLLKETPTDDEEGM